MSDHSGENSDSSDQLSDGVRMSDHSGENSGLSDRRSDGVRTSNRDGPNGDDGGPLRGLGEALGRRDVALATAFAVGLLLTAGLGPMVVDARPAFEIPVYSATDGDNLDNVSAEAWGRAPAATVPLSSSGAAVPAADNTTVEEISLEAAQTDDRLYLRVSWDDATRDMSTGAVRAFSDSVAVQIPVNETARPPIAMGGSSNKVNVWYWSADGTSQELLAGGPGSTTQFNRSQVRTNATYADGEWRVVFSRPLSAEATNRTSIPTDADMDVAVAVWNGSNGERSGQKAASSWYYLALGPGPQGPPYETLLWVLAGLAIIGSALVTAEGIRRTRGE
jgi:DMSO reductase family type II enzyme heme b subunit